MSFVGRALSFKFVKGADAQGKPQTFANGSDTIEIPAGNMASVKVLNANTPGMGHADITIWGLTPDIMNAVNTLGIIVRLQPANLVAVYASDADGSNKSEVFRGCIWEAKPLFDRQPEAPLWIDAYAGLDIAVGMADPVSFTGSADVTVILKQLCDRAGYKFEPNGVTGVSLSRSYLWGSPRGQIISVLQSVLTRGIGGAFVENQTVAIWPINGARGGVIPLIKPGTTQEPGTLIGYPTYTIGGIQFRCIYNPNVRFGGQVQLETSLFQASGIWNVIAGLSATLDAQIPGGKWENLIEGTRQGTSSPIVVPSGG